MTPPDGSDRRGWAMAPQDTRERTCEYTGSPLFSVFHSLRVARAPDPQTTTVTRTYEATVEWTSRHSLPEWLVAVAETCTPYDADRFRTMTGDGGDDRGDAGDDRDRDDGAHDGHDRTAADDGRFRSSPADATVAPPADPDPALSDRYHYWNTPLGRLQRDDCYPASVTSLTVDLVEGPDAAWTGDATAGPPADHLPADRERYARVGLEFVARQRLREEESPGSAVERSAAGASPNGAPEASPSSGWETVGTRDHLATDPLPDLVDATLAPALRDRSVTRAVEEVLAQLAAVEEAFRWSDADPYAIPDRAVDAATSPPE